MIGLFKRLIAWFLEKIANRISDPAPKGQDGYFDKAGGDDTLQAEIKRILLNTAVSLRNKDSKSTKTPDGNNDADLGDLVGGGGGFGDDESPLEAALPFPARMVAMIKGCKERVTGIPRWLKLVVVATLPICVLYISFYFLLVTPPSTNSEDIFRYKKGKPLVRIGYIKEWATSSVMTSLLSEAMDTNLNVDITAKAVSQNKLTDLWQMMVNNGADITPSIWLPNTHAAFILDAGSSIVDLGAWLTGAKLGLVVPEYMNIDSIEDLANQGGGGGTIYGIDPDSKLHHMTKRAIELYGLSNYRVIGKSDKFMITQLEEALKNKEDIVVAAWTPHWIFGEWKVKMLDDPLRVYGKSEDIHIFVSSEFNDSFPDICKFLSKVKLDLKQISDLMASARRLGSTGGAANKWMHAHKETVLEWDDNNSD